MKLHIRHNTTYRYDSPVSYGLQQVRLTPVTSAQQTVLDWDIGVTGGAVELRFADHYENHTLLIKVAPGATEVSVDVAGTVQTHCTDGIFGKTYGTAPLWHFRQSTARTQAGQGIAKLAKVIGKAPSALDGLHALSAAILRAAPYDKGKTQARTTAEESLRAGGGGLPGSRANFYRRRPQCRHPRALCQRLSDDERPGRSGCQPRLGRGAYRWAGLGRL